MQSFTRVSGPAAPLMLNNVDTDVIIRIERLTNLGRDQLGPYALEAWRYDENGSENPAFVLNQPPFRGAPILLAGDNFGCGSSREGAVWALMGAGIHCVIAPSFGNIFYNNCFQNGLLPVVLSEAAISMLAAKASHGAPLTIDLKSQTVTAPDGELLRFDIDRQRRDTMLAGLDEISQTLLNEDQISVWQANDRLSRPWIWNTVVQSADVAKT